MLDILRSYSAPGFVPDGAACNFDKHLYNNLADIEEKNKLFAYTVAVSPDVWRAGKSCEH
jgi:hypothetical protein